ncbi:hypothetical protein GRI34_05950 [Erythrobacter aquimaris]|uniref:Uncharacterized protein n=1 Tax=Qipengyuania aquimaris TaxID=255984 RepID=A0A6I4TJJ2_9SPHN|nr:hypothetical protein [Qipengyuania aquimaris]MXO95966.1 hypothetical protein [Qipengyuania aquimaris]
MRVDISTHVLREQDNIYVVRPGEDYWLFDHFRRSNRIFLDFPDLDLDPLEELPEDKEMRLQVVRSLAIRDWHDNDNFGPRPADDTSDFEGQDYRQRLGRYIGAIRKLRELPEGTVIVVPGEGYFGEVLIGKLVGLPHMHSWQAIYDGEPMLARRVKWFRSKQRGTFSDLMRDRLSRPDPVMLLDRSLRKEVVAAGFDQYIFAGTFSARINTEEDDFNTLNEYYIQSFLNYITGVLIAAEQGVENQVPYAEAINYLREHPERAMELKLNINSRGFQRIIDHTVAPLATVALLTAGIAYGADLGNVDLAQAIQIVNSAAPNDDCTIEVAQRVESARELMMLDDWEQQCRQLHDVEEATGLSTEMGVEDDEA